MAHVEKNKLDSVFNVMLILCSFWKQYTTERKHQTINASFRYDELPNGNVDDSHTRSNWTFVKTNVKRKEKWGNFIFINRKNKNKFYMGFMHFYALTNVFSSKLSNKTVPTSLCKTFEHKRH